MRHFKRFVHTMIRAGIFTAYVWSATSEERAQWEEAARLEEDDDEEDEVGQRTAAYLTTGLITAAREVAKAHDAGERCGPHHQATASLLSDIEDSTTAYRIIQHLLDIVAQTISDEDVKDMVTSIITTELEEDGPHHH